MSIHINRRVGGLLTAMSPIILPDGASRLVVDSRLRPQAVRGHASGAVLALCRHADLVIGGALQCRSYQTLWRCLQVYSLG